MAKPARTALVIIFTGVEEVEAVTTIDLLRRAGITVTVASLGPERRVTGRSNIFLEAETDLTGALEWQHDALVLPGGPGTKHLRETPAVIELVERQAASGRLVAAICAAPTVLKDAGVLLGRKHTGHTSVEAELPEMLKSKAVVRDGIVITSRGAGTAIPFALEIIRTLVSDSAAKQVAKSICYPR
jgi:4-methyl-5(b-hydroxyethyl)-thiazole monophosphate biosynthesis